MSAPSFVRPGLGWFLLLDGGLVALSAVAVSEDAHTAASDVVPLPPRSALQRLLAFAVGLHVFEALVARRLARCHRASTACPTRSSTRRGQRSREQ